MMQQIKLAARPPIHDVLAFNLPIAGRRTFGRIQHHEEKYQPCLGTRFNPAACCINESHNENPQWVSMGCIIFSSWAEKGQLNEITRMCRFRYDSHLSSCIFLRLDEFNQGHRDKFPRTVLCNLQPQFEDDIFSSQSLHSPKLFLMKLS